MSSAATSVSLAHLAEAAAALSKIGSDFETVNGGTVPNEDANKTENFQVEGQANDRRDYSASLVSDDDDLQQQQDDDRSKANSSNMSKEIFPQRLLAILSDPSLTDIIAWLPNGRSFVILRPDVLAEEILPKYLPPAEHGRGGTVKYPSFTRKLNRWGFRQVTRGPSTGAFHHPMFSRDQPELCLEMVCQKSRKRKSSDRSPSPLQEIGLHKTLSLSSTTSSSSSSLSCSSRMLPPKKRRLSSLIGLELSSAGVASLRSDSLETADSAAVLQCRDMVENDTNAGTAVETVLQNNVVKTMIRNNAEFVASVLKQRDEMERLKIAQSMLLKAFLDASEKL